ncbi:MarR family transcriptional regulator, partial [mine drainage metagenome]
MSTVAKNRRPRAAPNSLLRPHDYEVLAEFRYVLTKFLAFSEHAAHRAGLAPRQHQALLAIKGYPG